MIEDGQLEQRVAKRYAGWSREVGQQILQGKCRWRKPPGMPNSITLILSIKADIRNYSKHGQCLSLRMNPACMPRGALITGAIHRD